jgi:hypothetical protein
MSDASVSSTKMKYIVLDFRMPVIFPAWLEHWEVAGKFPGREPTSAGRIRFKDNELEVYDRSLSLGLEPHFRDLELIAQLLES